jgi:hypothetical protein
MSRWGLERGRLLAVRWAAHIATRSHVLNESNRATVSHRTSNTANTSTSCWSKPDRLIQGGIPAYRLLSVLNLSHASFSVLNTAALIIRCSVLASWGI